MQHAGIAVGCATMAQHIASSSAQQCMSLQRCVARRQVVSARAKPSTRWRCGQRRSVLPNVALRSMQVLVMLVHWPKHGGRGCKLGCGEAGDGRAVGKGFKTRSLPTVSLHPGVLPSSPFCSSQTYACSHVCVCVRVYVCAHVSMCPCVHRCIHACMRTRMRACVRTCVCTCMSACVGRSAYLCMCACTCIYIHVYACICMHIYVFVCLCISMRIHAYICMHVCTYIYM